MKTTLSALPSSLLSARCFPLFSLNMSFKIIGVRAGGSRGAAAPPVTEIFGNFSGKTLMIRAKALQRKYSKRLSKLDLKATFFDVCSAEFREYARFQLK